ncbi:MAG: heparan-alpha-glucosaminide N-acetyltransferase domain-containing protein [Oscillospiraceae bacterium]|nr:heparan-alpha-glucosaminide N-acetyltransferase domain-containing protein [Oscillospiraceae bacterium]
MVRERNLAIDRYRGLAIVLMVLVDALEDVARVPAWCKHAPDTGFTIADLVAPMFIFAIAATYRQSFLRRAEKGGAYAHFTGRYLAIIGLGAIFSAGGSVVELATTWGVLQAIGAAGLITLLVIKLPTLARAGAGLGILAAFQLASSLSPGFAEGVFTGDHGGFTGSLSWSAMLILCTVIIDLYNKGIKPFLLGTGVLSVLAAGSLFLVPISKHRMSLSYVLVSVALCAVLYLLADMLSKKLPAKKGLLVWWGENPLLLYVLHLILLILARIPFEEVKPLVPGLAAVAAMVVLLSLIAWALHRKDKRFSL